MGTGFTEDARRLGILYAVAVVILLVAYAVTLGVGFASLGSPGDPGGGLASTSEAASLRA
jgi:hypothetical protein